MATVKVRATGKVREVTIPISEKGFVALRAGQEAEAMLGVPTGDPAHPCRVKYVEGCGYIERVKDK